MLTQINVTPEPLSAGAAPSQSLGPAASGIWTKTPLCLAGYLSTSPTNSTRLEPREPTCVLKGAPQDRGLLFRRMKVVMMPKQPDASCVPGPLALAHSVFPAASKRGHHNHSLPRRGDSAVSSLAKASSPKTMALAHGGALRVVRTAEGRDVAPPSTHTHGRALPKSIPRHSGGRRHVGPGRDGNTGPAHCLTDFMYRQHRPSHLSENDRVGAVAQRRGPRPRALPLHARGSLCRRSWPLKSTTFSAARAIFIS